MPVVVSQFLVDVKSGCFPENQQKVTFEENA